MYLLSLNLYDYKVKGRTDFGHNDNSLSTDKRKAMYPIIPSRYLSKKPDGFTLGKYHHKYFRLPIDLNDITHCLVIGAPGSFKSSTLLNALIWNFNFAEQKDKFKFVNLPFERGEILFSNGFFYLYGYSQTTR